jgi:hypothetical protein
MGIVEFILSHPKGLHPSYKAGYYPKVLTPNVFIRDSVTTCSGFLIEASGKVCDSYQAASCGKLTR